MGGAPLYAGSALPVLTEAVGTRLLHVEVGQFFSQAGWAREAQGAALQRITRTRASAPGANLTGTDVLRMCTSLWAVLARLGTVDDRDLPIS